MTKEQRNLLLTAIENNGRVLHNANDLDNEVWDKLEALNNGGDDQELFDKVNNFLNSREL